MRHLYDSGFAVCAGNADHQKRPRRMPVPLCRQPREQLMIEGLQSMKKPFRNDFFAKSDENLHDGRYTIFMEKIQKEWIVGEKSWSLERVRARRGIAEPDFDRDLHDPFLFQDMEAAVQLIKNAIDANEKIIIFGDYDADGTSGAVVFHDFFALIDYQNYAVYIPYRFREGYGLQKKHVEEFLSKDAKLIITIDCGITSFEEIKYAEEHGARVIVIDHHLIPPQWPPASAIIDPKRESDPYPYKFLSGAGLAWKVIAAFLRRHLPQRVGQERWFLDVVAIAAVADMVPLTEENRTLVAYGLKVLEKTRRLGLRALYQRAGLAGPLTTEDIGFTIAPRINAASRMDHANLSFSLLTTSSRQEAQWLANRLEEKNRERKVLVEQIVKEIESKFLISNSQFLIMVTGNKKWPPGVLGIAATRIMERFRVPVFLWGGPPAEAGLDHDASQDIYRGSCRSLGDVNVVELMRAAHENGSNPLFEDFGGHKQAGGFAIVPDRIEELAPRLAEALDAMPKEDIADQLLLEAPLKPEDVTEDIFEEIEQLQPFGVGNPKPFFLFSGAEIREVKELGNGKGYLKLLIARERQASLEAVSFNGLGHEWLGKLKVGDRVDLAAAVERNTWNGNTNLRLRVVDMRS